jgi:hypothetical protein
MELPMESQGEVQSAPSQPRSALRDAIHYWERRRIFYNVALIAVVLAWIAGTWPHFRPALNLPTLGIMAVLALLANVCYCAAYLVDIPAQHWSFATAWWQRGRLGLWSAGTLFAALLANYWIGDEIFPFVR